MNKNPNMARKLPPEHYRKMVAARTAKRPTDRERFDSKVDRSGGPDACWIWISAVSPDGYGRFSFRGVALNAHRVAMILHLGAVPDDKDVDHFRCKERRCVNPAHLRLATERENATENNESPLARNARKTHCKYGHPLSGDNIRVRTVPGPRGSPCTTRLCLACYGPGGIRKVKNPKGATA